MLKIGEFSKLSQMTVKALRFYDKVGLLKPADLDEWTGYRFYTTDQLTTAARIKSYRQLDWHYGFGGIFCKHLFQSLRLGD